ncbi:MAG: hypothetical protein ACTSSI_14240 [Candidatus Helarchaeota archaeon]
MSLPYGLAYYIRTLDIRHRLVGYRHDTCGRIYFSSKRLNFCPECGRGGTIEKVSLLRHGGVGSIDSISIVRDLPKGMEWVGNRAVGIVIIDYEGIKVSVPTEFTDIDIPSKVPFQTHKWIGKNVEPTVRILDYNPEGAIYYGVKFRPIPPEKKIQRPFTEKLVECKNPGIASIGVCLPRYRTSAEEMARAYHIDPNYILKGLGVQKVSVPGWDQDTGTFAMDAAFDALSKLPREIIDTIGMIVVGSESKPYSVKPTATNVLSYVGAPHDIICYDAEFACIAAGMQIKPAISMIKTGEIDTALIIGADVSQGFPGDPLDLDTGAGGVCFVVSKYNVILEYLNMKTHAGDHPDFARRKHHIYPFHGYSLTGDPSYFAFQEAAINAALKACDLKPEDISAATFHQPNYNFEFKEVRKYGFDIESRKKRGMKPVIIGKPVIQIGNTYSAATMFGLAEIINEEYHDFDLSEEEARKMGFENPKEPRITLQEGDLVLTGWYGSGAAGGCGIFKITSLYPKYREATNSFSYLITISGEIGGIRKVSLLTRYFAKDMIKKS